MSKPVINEMVRILICLLNLEGRRDDAALIKSRINSHLLPATLGWYSGETGDVGRLAHKILSENGNI